MRALNAWLISNSCGALEVGETWRSELLTAIGFDLSSLSPHSALLQSQVTEELWLATHERWVERASCGGAERSGVTPRKERTQGMAVHPVCVNSAGLDGRDCGGTKCMSSNMRDAEPWENDIPSPFYAASTHVGASEATACGFVALPAAIRNPLSGSSYANANMVLYGRVVNSQARPVPRATVEIWHADQYGRFGEIATPLAEAHRAAGSLPKSERSETGCRAALTTDDHGRFSVRTVLPGRYGPPQHVELRVTAEGITPLVTKIYVGDDPFFETTLRENIASLRVEQRVVFPTVVDATNRTVNVTVVVRPSNADGRQFRGAWSDGRGFVDVASNGVHFLAVEVPTPRRWGSIGGEHDDAFTIRNASATPIVSSGLTARCGVASIDSCPGIDTYVL
ncbi:hypothetical protein CTAYLR_005041 [Chrysophaeum taylorii]|uniref:Intradiol ring-cleavage dioxygenases domain-containing protein n=1 Tax=Chrysophaeum taylorii TaxID=2483200 RepID=A0AAD7XMI9_9STRA|nr:hypothetical protein CTAYLR_005041 [Chrysophaeum taylorii]